MERELEIQVTTKEKNLDAGNNGDPNTPRDIYNNIQIDNLKSIKVYLDKTRGLKLIDNETAYRLRLITENKYSANENAYFIISDNTIKDMEKAGYKIIYEPWIFYANDEKKEFDLKSNSNDIEELTELKEQLLNQTIEKPNQGFVR